MKNKKIIFLILTVGFLTTLLFTSCDIKNPVDGLELRVKTLARTTVVSLGIYDASTNNLVSGKNIVVSFKGANKANVISMSNEKITEASTDIGLVTFAIDDNIIPTPENPVELTAVVQVDGYISSSAQLFITSPGASSHSINIANYTTTPEGVVSNKEDGDVDGDGAVGTITIASGDDPNTGASSTITIPDGTKFYNKSGEVLTGTVSTRVTYFNPLDEESLNSFPGGFAVNDGTNDGNFITAGFTAIDMTVGGEDVDNFGSGSITIDFEIPTEVVNPETGNKVAAGDKIPLWSYDEDTGVWTNEGEVTVPSVLAKTANGKNVFKVSKEINHLSYWNLDWFWDACYEGIKINIIGDCFTTLQIKAKRISDGRYFYSGYVNASDPLVQLYRAPRDVPVMIEVYDVTIYPPQLVGTTQVNNLCADETVDLVVSLTTDLTEVSLIATAVCHNSDGTVKSRFYPDNFTIWAKSPQNPNWQNIGVVTDGQITACLNIGTTYTFGTYIDGSWVSRSYTIDKDNYDIEFSDLDYPDEMRDFCN